jgi:predicted RND superfamily exporter protein
MIQKALIEFAINKPKQVILLMALLTIVFLAAFPSLTTDTDPVHMLPANNHAVKLWENTKKEFNISDMIGVAITSKDGSTMFTADRLTRIKQLTDEILKIKMQAPKETSFSKFFKKLQFLKDHEAVDKDPEIFIKEDVISLNTLDDIVLNKNGELLVTPVMKHAPKSDAEAKKILDVINSNPMVSGKVFTKSGDMVGIFLPLKEGKKEQAFYLSQRMEKILKKYLKSDETYYMGGLPLAESTFGDEMFIQMGVYAPLAGLVIFLLMLFFFRSPKIVAAPMILGMITVIWAMGALIYSGNAIHIMSSMIPIFLLPIAVLNSIHILSKLSHQISKFDNKADAIREVMHELFYPMLYTSLTTITGFASLATTGIPPVIVFGITIAFGVFLAWLLSMIFIPAYTMLLSDNALKAYAAQGTKKSVVVEFVHGFKNFAQKFPVGIMIGSVVILIISYIGVTKIIVNDNPVRWFKKDHYLRIADVHMNGKLDGTYSANIVFSIPQAALPEKKEVTNSDDEFDDFDQAEEEQVIPSVRDPKVVNYIHKLEKFLLNEKQKNSQKNLVGGVTSIVDVLKKIGKVTFNDDSVPQTRQKISQYIFLFESGDIKKGKDLWKIILRDSNSRSTQMWVFFKSGDNQLMTETMEAVKEFMKNNPPPSFSKDGKQYPLTVEWTGLMNINNVWQSEMVSGMKSSLIGSFVIVFIMMVFLFRSVIWGVIAMLPLSITIMLIYGLIGYSGKFYDMPIAVLSSLTLGLSVDFAIHFIEHALFFNKRNKDFQKTYDEIFAGTAQAIWRNVLVIAIGFSPLFFAGLVPYLTVGTFFFLIMLVSGLTTLILMPAILAKFHKGLKGFKEYKA